MLSFDQLEAWAPDHVCAHHTPRDPAVQAAYDLHIKEVQEQYTSLKAYLLSKVFKRPVFVDSSNPGKRCALNFLKSATPVWVLRPNEFPYDVEPGVEHHVAWRSSPDPPPPGELEALLAARWPPAEFQLAWWVNEPTIRTVPEFHHAQVFVRRC